jgi:hypothetical protein
MSPAGASARTAEEVFADHRRRMSDGNLDEVVRNYAQDAVFVRPDLTLRGRDGVKQGLTELLAQPPDARWEMHPVIAGEVVHLLWTARSRHAQVLDGVDTFVIRDGLIHAQTVRYTVRPATV